MHLESNRGIRMDAATWLTISIIGYSLAGILLIVTIILFYKMNILAIIGDLTGRTAARQIAELREMNKMTGNKRLQPNAFKGLLSKQLTRDRLEKTEESSQPPLGPTEIIDETEILEDLDATVILSEDTEVLSKEIAATEWLNDTSELSNHKPGTTVLSDSDEDIAIPAVGFKKVKDIKVTHSNEVIK